jgi:hypothetical protein
MKEEDPVLVFVVEDERNLFVNFRQPGSGWV